ncbi:unnamed protein product [Heligmosomoides polygyrus]|uniref:MgtE domain-containing protein n=1 Tax=Heligmosomoides polygyrus TaxID=6339 RepID=A0A183G4H1_HELPZ|nr:unnamed protein product [Heligmosomoides polygyrus]
MSPAPEGTEGERIGKDNVGYNASEENDNPPVTNVVPELLAVCPPLQGMKGNLDMTFTSRLGTMAHQGRLQGDGYFEGILRSMCLIQAQAVFISLFATLITFVLETLRVGIGHHPPTTNFLFLGSNAVMAMCIACGISSSGTQATGVVRSLGIVRTLNVKETEYLATDVNEHGSIKINGTELSRVTSFKYLGSTVTSDGSLITVIRPAATYGAECWPVTKEIESRLSVMVTKMLRWAAGVTRLDRARNDAIRQRFGVAPIAEKLREARLRWYGHVLRANDDTVRKIGLNMRSLESGPGDA